MGFSRRTNWTREPAPSFAAVERARARGRVLADLTVGNPTRIALGDRSASIARLGDAAGTDYAPASRGMRSARAAVAAYCRERGREIEPDDVIVTSSTSEAYGWLFKLLCDPGDRVLVPRPSYPLFPFIADLELTTLVPYDLLRVEGWRIDVGGLERSIGEGGARAILAVHPNNPTGTFVHPDDRAALIALAERYDLALIVDEVFLDYTLDAEAPGVSFAGESSALTFVLSGLSKVALLPQAKLAWMVASGPGAEEARARLEIIADTYLSVSTAVQLALPGLLDDAKPVRRALCQRLRANRDIVSTVVRKHAALRVIPAAGGWYACIEIPRLRSDDAWCADLVTEEGIVVHPGHFYEMQEDGVMVVSLLAEDLREPLERAAAFWAG